MKVLPMMKNQTRNVDHPSNVLLVLLEVEMICVCWPSALLFRLDFVDNVSPNEYMFLPHSKSSPVKWGEQALACENLCRLVKWEKTSSCREGTFRSPEKRIILRNPCDRDHYIHQRFPKSHFANGPISTLRACNNHHSLQSSLQDLLYSSQLWCLWDRG